MQYLNQKDLAKWRKENEPLECPLLNYQAKAWVVDHCHNNGQVRGVVSFDGNAFLGKIENAYKRLARHSSHTPLPMVLRNLATYLEKKETNILHPVGYRQLYKRYNRLSKNLQLDILYKFGIKRSLINECKNSKERTNLYKKIIKNDNKIKAHFHRK
jgi:hypothetical protein